MIALKQTQQSGNYKGKADLSNWMVQALKQTQQSGNVEMYLVSGDLI